MIKSLWIKSSINRRSSSKYFPICLSINSTSASFSRGWVWQRETEVKIWSGEEHQAVSVLLLALLLNHLFLVGYKPACESWFWWEIETIFNVKTMLLKALFQNASMTVSYVRQLFLETVSNQNQLDVPCSLILSSNVDHTFGRPVLMYISQA